MRSYKEVCEAIDVKIASTTFGRVFRLEGSGHVHLDTRSSLGPVLTYEQPKERKGSKFLTEIRAGLTTFFTMAYIIAVNVSLLSAYACWILTAKGFYSISKRWPLRLH
jgi:adenine/guanine/hypoxanthine permease